MNGKLALEGEDWGELYRAEVGALLHAGENVFAVEAENEAGAAGLLLETALRDTETKAAVVSDETWRVHRDAEAGWQATGFDDSEWGTAVELGRPPVGPWGDVGDPRLGQ